MKTLTIVLSILAAAAAVAAVVAGWRGRTEVTPLRRAAAEQRHELERVREETGAVNLKYRALVEGATQIPDSLRTAYTGEYQRQAQEYRKRIYRLEREEREAQRLLRKSERRLAEARARLRRRVLILAAAAVVLAAGAAGAGRAARAGAIPS